GGGRRQGAMDGGGGGGDRRRGRRGEAGPGAARPRGHEDGARAHRRGPGRGTRGACRGRTDGRSRRGPHRRDCGRGGVMASPEPVGYEVRGLAAWITLASPATRNALSGPMIQALKAALDRALGDPAVRVVVLTGTGPAFCAGADLKGGGAALAPGAGARNPCVEILKDMWDGPKPVIVAANGHAFGGGVGLVAAADVSIAVEGATFSFSEVRVGVIPAIISVVVLPKLGVHQTMRLFLTGRRFDAREALDLGLLHRVVP